MLRNIAVWQIKLRSHFLLFVEDAALKTCPVGRFYSSTSILNKLIFFLQLNRDVLPFPCFCLKTSESGISKSKIFVMFNSVRQTEDETNV